VLERFRDLFALILLPVLALGVGGGLLFARRVLAPLRDLAATVDRIATTGRLGERVPERGTGDELDALASLVNGMLARVEALVAGMRGTLDDAAHDLRTPLTRLRAGAERALLSDPATHPDALSDAVEETDAVLAILDAVMDVAEADAGTLPLHYAPVDLADIADQVADLYALVAEEKGVELAWKRAEPVVAWADATRVRQAVANLVDNALKYTPPGGQVRVEVFDENEHALLTVADNGLGVAPEDRLRIWDRLYRGDVSRSERGLGLGLSVVRAIAEAHGGAATVEEAPGGGSRFTLSLPARPGTRAS
jgi:signal transduction histidine kinase